MQIPQVSQNGNNLVSKNQIKNSDILNFEESKELGLHLLYKRYEQHLSEGNDPSVYQFHDPNKPFSQVKELNSVVGAIKHFYRSNSQSNSFGFMMSGE